jgi:hypothetical protein
VVDGQEDRLARVDLSGDKLGDSAVVRQPDVPRLEAGAIAETRVLLQRRQCV